MFLNCFYLFVNFSPFTLLKFASIKKASQSSSEEYIGLVSYWNKLFLAEKL